MTKSKSLFTAFILLLFIHSFTISQVHIGVIAGMSYDSAIESESEITSLGTGGFQTQENGSFIDWTLNPSIGLTADIQLGKQGYNETFLNVGLVYKSNRLKYSDELTFDFDYLEIPIGAVSYPLDNRNIFITGYIIPTILLSDEVKTPDNLIFLGEGFNSFDLRFKAGGGIRLSKAMRAGINVSFGAISFAKDADINSLYLGLDLAYFVNK